MKDTSYLIEGKEKFTHIQIHESRFTAKIAPELKNELVKLEKQGVKNIIFDLSSVAYCDSSALSAILIANKMCSDNNGLMVLCNVSPNVMKLIEISKLQDLLTIVPKYDEAVDFLYMDELEKGLDDVNPN